MCVQVTLVVKQNVRVHGRPSYHTQHNLLAFGGEVWFYKETFKTEVNQHFSLMLSDSSQKEVR